MTFLIFLANRKRVSRKFRQQICTRTDLPCLNFGTWRGRLFYQIIVEHRWACWVELLNSTQQGLSKLWNLLNSTQLNLTQQGWSTCRIQKRWSIFPALHARILPVASRRHVLMNLLWWSRDEITKFVSSRFLSLESRFVVILRSTLRCITKGWRWALPCTTGYNENFPWLYPLRCVYFNHTCYSLENFILLYYTNDLIYATRFASLLHKSLLKSVLFLPRLISIFTTQIRGWSAFWKEVDWFEIKLRF